MSKSMTTVEDANKYNMEALLGKTLTSKSGEVATLNALKGKYVGLYFSAHWCPPCRGFTPRLAKLYAELVDQQKKNFEVVFVSSDRDQKHFDEYYAEMPWLALPFADRGRKASLSSEFDVSGIPTLLLFSPEGELYEKEGRAKVSAGAAAFPWLPKPFSELIAGEYLQMKDGELESREEVSFAGKVIGFYFSASWCPPCQRFTPELVKTYNAVRAAGKPFEVVYVSADRDEDSFEKYFAKMPWLSLPFEDARCDELRSRFRVEGFPTLVIADENGAVISSEGRGDVDADPEGADFPWREQPFQGIHRAGNRSQMVILFAGVLSEGEQRDSKMALLKSIAEEVAAENQQLGFYYIMDPAHCAHVRSQLSADDDVMLVTMPSRSFLTADEITAEAVRECALH